MTLKFKVFGYVLAELDLEFGEDASTTVVPLAAKGTKWMSNLWFKGMMR